MDIRLLRHPAGHLLFILLLGILAYAHSFVAPFTLDDMYSITLNPVIQDLRNYLPGGVGYSHNPRRLIGYFTFAVNYRWGQDAVFGYHLVNLAIHLATALLLYTLARLTFRTPLLAGSRLAPQATAVALLAALLFVVHPVQTQAVTYIVQRLTSLCTFFYLLSLLLYAWGRLRMEESKEVTASAGKGKKQPPAPSPGSPWFWLPFAGAFLAALLAMFTKEIAFTLPFSIVLYEACFFRGSWKPRLACLSPLLLTLPIIPVAVLVAGGEPPLHDAAESGLLRAQSALPRHEYLLTQIRGIATYLRLLVLPVNQNLDYDYPVYTTFFTPPVFLSFTLLAGLLGLAVWLYRVSAPRPLQAASPQLPAPELRIIAFGIFWFFLTLSVESGLIPIADLVAEHRLYLPSTGMALGAATLCLLAREKTARWLGGQIPLLLAAGCVVVLTVTTWQRNQVWQDNLTLWGDVVRKSPGKARGWYNYGCYLSDANRQEEAVRALSRAVEINPEYAQAWHNLGRAYLLLRKTEPAIVSLQAAVRLDPLMDNAILNLAVALNGSSLYNETVSLLEKTRQRAPDWPELHLHLGLAYAGLGDDAAAQRELAALRRLSPRLAQVLADGITVARQAQDSPQDSP